MRVDGKSSRYHERTRAELPLQVRYKESEETEWTEEGRVLEVTRFGAGFTLQRPVELKRLVSLTFAMPSDLRVFDHAAKLYRIWSVIRYLRLLSLDDADRILLMIGAAFIGAVPPTSFLRDPKTLFDLKPALGHEGLWSPREASRRVGRYVRSEETRENIVKPIELKVLDKNGFVVGCDNCETVNISTHGAAVSTTLTVESGQFLLIRSLQHATSLLAIVRGFRRGDSDDASLLHLEFISGNWPH